MQRTVIDRFGQEYLEEISPGVLLVATDGEVERVRVVERVSLMDVTSRHVEQIARFEDDIDAWLDSVDHVSVQITTGFQRQDLVVVQWFVDAPVLFPFELKDECIDVV